MSVYPLLFDNPHLRERLGLLARSIAASRARRRMSATVEEDVGTLGLVILGLVGLLVEKGVITRDDLLGHLHRIDGLDGAADGKVTPDQVRAALGFAVATPAPPRAPTPKRRGRASR